MSINGVQWFIKELLQDLVVPGNAGTLEAYITPPDPKVDNPRPVAYVWPSTGSERRRSLPRNVAGLGSPAGWKDDTHQVQVYVVWFAGDDEPDIDSAFPAVIDAITRALRFSTPNPAYVTDPVTGEITQVVDVGENITYEIVPIHAMADQRWNRYDARITVSVLEVFQA